MDNYNEPHHGEESYYGSQKLYRKSFWQRRRGFVITVGSLVMVVAILVAIIFSLLTSRTQATTPPSSQNVPTQTASVNTPGSSTSEPVTTAAPTVLATVTAGTFTEPNGGLRLHTNADDPITVTITSMTYNPAENKMVWDLVLKNVSSSDQPVNGGTLTLKSNVEGDDYTHQASIPGPDKTMLPGDQIQEKATFTFLPYQKASGASYTLTSSLEISKDFLHDNFNTSTITFDPITMAF